MLGKTIQQLNIGDSASYTKQITAEMVENFAKLTGDCNPVHLDENYAKETIFKKRISHGQLVASLFSGIFGMQLPGEGAIYLAQNSKFISPVFLNDTITATVTIKEINVERNRVIFDTTATNQDGVKVIIGDATILPRK